MDSDIGKTREKITKDALRHYVDRLKKIEENENEVLFTDNLKTDLKNEQVKAEEIIEHIQKNGFEIFDPEFGVQKSIFQEDSMKNTLTNALLCYYHDMVETSKIILKKLPRAPDLPLLKEEIKFCKEFLNRMHEAYKVETKVS